MTMVHIVYITDENYVMPTIVSIVSLMKNNYSKTQYNVEIITYNISDHARLQFDALEDAYVSCNVIRISKEIYKELAGNCLSKGIHVSEAALCKLNLTEFFPLEGRVLYLDSDVIIKEDISDLFKIDLTDYYVAAVDDMGDTVTDEGKSYLAERIGLDDRKYFNSGVMLLNLNKIREDQVSDRLIEYRKTGRNFFMDQDAFNYVLGSKRYCLPYKYNFRSSIVDEKKLSEINQLIRGKYHSVEQCIMQQSVIHMTDRWKPWRYNHPWFTKIFLEYYEQCPYRDVKLSLLSPIKYWRDSYLELLDKYNFCLKELEKQSHMIWKFPFDKIKRDARIVLYGAGNVGKDFYKQIKQTNYCEVSIWVDINHEKYGENVFEPEQIQTVKYDAVIIAVYGEDKYKEIREALKNLGVSESEIIKGVNDTNDAN